MNILNHRYSPSKKPVQAMGSEWLDSHHSCTSWTLGACVLSLVLTQTRSEDLAQNFDPVAVLEEV